MGKATGLPPEGWLYWEDKAKEVEKAYDLKGAKIARRQRCFNCDTILAMEFTDQLGSGGDFWSIQRGMWMKGRWFGNQVQCPVCGSEGKLPMDKPLSYERMQEVKS